MAIQGLGWSFNKAEGECSADMYVAREEVLAVRETLRAQAE